MSTESDERKTTQHHWDRWVFVFSIENSLPVELHNPSDARKKNNNFGVKLSWHCQVFCQFKATAFAAKTIPSNFPARTSVFHLTFSKLSTRKTDFWKSPILRMILSFFAWNHLFCKQTLAEKPSQTRRQTSTKLCEWRATTAFQFRRKI